MKKKLTVNTLALGNLKQRKKQYTIMIIGIILAMIFSSSSIFFVYSMRDSAIERSRANFGNQFRIDYIVGADESTYADMKNEGFYSEYGIAHNLGYAYGENKKNGAEVAWLDDDCKAMSNISFLDGDYPKNKNEIAVEISALYKLGFEDAKIGDTIQLNFTAQNEDKYVEKVVKKEYKLVGIASDKRQNMFATYQDDSLSTFVPAVFVAQNTEIDLGGKEQLLCYRNRPNIGSSTKAWKAYNEKEEKYLTQHHYTGRFEYIGAWNNLVIGTGTEISPVLNFTTVLSFVLMLASCLAIINAFNSNLKERKKQIGLLRAIGTTKKQIIDIFGREALIITLISTPISIGISYALVILMSGLFGDEFVVSKNYESLIVCIVVDIAVVMLSALIPLLSASKTPPMHAIRNINNNRKMKNKRIKSQKSFDMPSLLAKRNRMFYKSSNAIVCMILALTIILSCFGMGVASGIIDDEFLGYGYDYCIGGLEDDYGCYTYNEKYYENGLSNAEKQSIDSIPYVKSTFASKKCFANILVDDYDDYLKCIKGHQASYGGTYDFLADDFTFDTFVEKCLTKKSDHYYANMSDFKINSEYVPVELYAYDESFVKSLEINDGNIDINKLNSGEDVILIAPQKVVLDLELKNKKNRVDGFSTLLYCDDMISRAKKEDIVLSGESSYKVGDELPVTVINYTGEGIYAEADDKSQYERIDKTPKIGAIITPNKFSREYSGFTDFSIITTISGMEKFAKDQKYSLVEIDCNTEVTPMIDTLMTQQLQIISDKHNAYISSNYALRKEKQETQSLWYLIIISVSILSFAICAGIINNTITANIRENKKELGTLRAVGAGEREIILSYIKQLLSVLGIGYGIGFLVYALYLGVEYLFEVLIYKHTFSSTINLWSTILFCVILFAICSINLWAKVRKEMKNSIVENIREL